MPDLPVKPGDWVGLLTAISRLGMAPESNATESQIEVDLAGHILNRQIEQSNRDTIKLPAPALQTLYQARPKVNLIKEMMGPAEQSKNAGMILLHLLRLAVHWEEKASLENATKLLAADVKARGRPSSRATLKEHWRRYKNMSHFTAAMLLREMHATQLGVWPPKFPSEHSESEDAAPKRTRKAPLLARLRLLYRGFRGLVGFLNKELPYLFSEAEELRKYGERHRAHGQAAQEKTTLDPAETWKVPAGFQLVPVKIDFPKLSPAEVDILLDVNESKAD